MTRLCVGTRSDDDLVRTVDVASRLSRLSAVATHDWCEQWASCYSCVRNDMVIGTAIAATQDGEQFNVLEASGGIDATSSVNAIDPRLCFSGQKLLEWWPEGAKLPSAPEAMLLRESTTASQWAASKRGRAWDAAGVQDMLVAIVPLSQHDSHRFAIMEMGLRDPRAPFLSPDAAIIAATLPKLAERIVMAFGNDVSNPLDCLTEKEQRVLSQLILGKTVKVIAEQMGRSSHTVHDHVKSLHKKLSVSSRGELVARALGHAPPSADGEARRSRTQPFVRQVVGSADSPLLATM